jgi:outer membrane protein
MRFLSAAAALFLLAPGSASANELLRLYELAVNNDATLQAAAAQRDAARQARPIAFGALLPQVTGTGSTAADNLEILTFEGQKCVEGQIDPTTGRPQECTAKTTPYSVALSADMALFNWELIQRYSQAGSQVALAETTFRTAQQNLALRVAQAYFDVLNAADNVRFASANRDAVERQLDLAKKRFEVGLSAVTDVQEAQASYDLIVAQGIAAEQSLTNARAALNEITGGGEAQLNVLKEDMPLLGPNPDSVADWIKTAADGNFDLMGARLALEVADKDVSATRAKHYPTLAVNGTLSQQEQSGFQSGELRDERVTLQARLPIFAGFATQAAVRQAEATREQRKAELEGRRRLVERTTRQDYHGVIAGVSLVKARKQAVLSNTTALEASTVGLEVGARTQVDVLNAQQLLFAAQRDYSKSRYDYLMSILRLKSDAGQLVQKDLAEIDALLGPATSAAGAH